MKRMTKNSNEKMKRLISELAGQMKEAKRLDEEMKENLRSIGYGL